MSLFKTPQRDTLEVGSTSSFADLTQPPKSAFDFLFDNELATLEAPDLTPAPISFFDGAPIVASMGDYPAPPPPLDSPRFQAELQQVHAIAAGTPERLDSQAKWSRAPAISWNEVAHDLLAQHGVTREAASQLHRLLSIAQHDALVLAGRAKEEFFRPAPCEVDRSLESGGLREDISAYPSDHAAVAAASRDILLEFFPADRERIERLFFDHLTTRIAAGVSFPSDLSAGAAIGHHVANEVLTYVGRNKA